MAWDRDAELAKLQERGLSRQDMLVMGMYIYQRDLEHQGRIFAHAKAEHDRRKAKHTMEKRYKGGEKSGEMCSVFAEAQDDVFEADLAYRTAEQMVTADREALKVMHAELEKWRTEQANERAADDMHRRTGT